MPSIDILGVPHHYELIGPERQTSRPVLVYIHGWLLSRHYWQPLVQRLSTDYPCLTYDLRGFGDSQADVLTPISSYPTLGPFSLAAYARDLVLLLEQLQIDQAWLIGHSLGGSIALWAAKACPEKIQGVICLNAGGGIYLKEEFERFRSMGQRLVSFRPAWLATLPLVDLLFARLMVDQPLARPWGRQRIQDFVRADASAALGSLLGSTTEEEVHLLPQLVAQLSQPVYFLAGQKDMIMESKYVNYLASFHSLFYPLGQNVIEIPDCGHFAMLEQTQIVVEKMNYILCSSSC